MKNLIIAGLFTFTFVTPKDFNLQEFIMNARDIGIIAIYNKTWPTRNATVSTSGDVMQFRMYDAKLETPELKATLSALVNAATSPIITMQDLLDVQWAIANDTEKTLQEIVDALLEMEKIRRGE